MAEHYKALTRKYRPSSFDDIVSQSHVSSTLKNAISGNRLSHAYLFSGPRGVGKTTMARVLARAINGVDDSVDGEHLNQTLNIVEIDAASNNSVDDARHIREQVRIPPQNGDYKVFIIDEVHMLSKAAFNALLKTLEEPPEYAIFIFATTEPHKVLPTILSRVQRFDFKRLSVDEISDRIRHICQNEGINMDEGSINLIARKADGALRDALGIMDQAIALCGIDIQLSELEKALNVIGMDQLYALIQRIKSQQSADVLAYVDELLQAGYDMQELVVNLTEYLRNLYIAHSGKHLQLIEATDSVKEQLISLSKELSEDDILRMLHLCSEAQFKLKEAHQPRIQLEIIFLKMSSMPKAVSINRLLEHLEDLKKKPHSWSPVNVSQETGVIPPDETAGNAVAGNSNEQTNEVVENSSVSKHAQEEELATTTTHLVEQAKGLVESKPEQAPKQETAPVRGLTKIFGHNKDNESSTALGSKAPVVKEREKPIQFDEIDQEWMNFVEQLDGNQFSRHLKLLIGHALPHSLQHQKLILRVRDAFAAETIKTNQKKIETALFHYFTCILQVETTIVQPKEDEIEHLDPYEQFKKVQEQEPIIKTIVELFGAEPDF